VKYYKTNLLQVLHTKPQEVSVTYLEGLGGTSGAEVPSPATPFTRGAGTTAAPLCLGFCLGGS